MAEDFPALRDGAKWVAGFDAIVNHLRRQHNVDLDADLSDTQRADLIA
jgi:hypothetical protein